MLNDLLSRLFRADPTPLPEPDARLALGALLVRMARADRAYLLEEIEQIDTILAERGGLNPVEAAKMRALCERLADQMPETEQAAAIIRAATSDDEREATVRALWRVSLADGITPEAEEQLLVEAERALGVSPERALHLRLQATDDLAAANPR